MNKKRRGRQKGHITNLRDALLYLRYVSVFWVNFTERHTRLSDAINIVLEELDK